MNIFKRICDGLYNLGLGLWTTLKYLPGRSVTIQYPKEKMEMFERSRGMVVLLTDHETGKLNCTACMLCQRTCPVAAITITRAEDKDPVTKKRYATEFEIDTLMCCYCGLCEEVCNFTAIKLASKYEFATTDKSELLFDIKKLQELGMDVKYTPKAKRPAKPAVKKDDKPAAIKPVETKPEDTTPKDPEKPEDKQ